MKCLTYNVWFDDFNKEERYQVIMQMLQESDAEFICLQEVTQTFMTQYILKAPFIRENYFISGNTISGYGVLILTKFPSHFYEVPLPTKMARSLLICEPLKGDKLFAIATVHLESGGALS